ncbi:Sec-independent protein translocase subunit TatA [Blastococcus sp. HT6-30]|uniref:Sec-independent protein translocase subunit TatA n=1 Tax=Blastococcus sp. HT6-30 TaxID=3144843 RepID=UPI00321A23C6
MNLGPMEIGLILLAVLLLFGYKKLPDASRSLGRSLRIFKGEMKGMKDDNGPGKDVVAEDAGSTAVARRELLPPSTAAERDGTSAAGVDSAR